MQPRRLWYTRSGQVIRGPFPSGLIRRYLLLGRILETDEISLDQIIWHPVSHFPELIPEELQGERNDPMFEERLRIARLREDERAKDRRHGEESVSLEQLKKRRGSDRRQPEPEDVLNRREVRNKIIGFGSTDKRTGRRISVVTLVLFLVVLGVSYNLTTSRQQVMVFKCEETAGERVTWSNCKKEGISLRGKVMKDAIITNTSMQGADFTDADLTDSLLAYSNFSNVDFSNANLSKVRMKGAVMRRAVFINTNMESVDAPFGIFQGAFFKDVNLENADFTNADLAGAVMENVNLKGARLGGATWINGERCTIQSVGQCIPEEN